MSEHSDDALEEVVTNMLIEPRPVTACHSPKKSFGISSSDTATVETVKRKRTRREIIASLEAADKGE